MTAERSMKTCEVSEGSFYTKTWRVNEMITSVQGEDQRTKSNHLLVRTIMDKQRWWCWWWYKINSDGDEELTMIRSLFSSVKHSPQLSSSDLSPPQSSSPSHCQILMMHFPLPHWNSFGSQGKRFTAIHTHSNLLFVICERQSVLVPVWSFTCAA